MLVIEVKTSRFDLPLQALRSVEKSGGSKKVGGGVGLKPYKKRLLNIWHFLQKVGGLKPRSPPAPRCLVGPVVP